MPSGGAIHTMITNLGGTGLGSFLWIQPDLTAIKRGAVQMQCNGRLTLARVANLVVSEPVCNVANRSLVKGCILGAD